MDAWKQKPIHHGIWVSNGSNDAYSQHNQLPMTSGLVSTIRMHMHLNLAMSHFAIRVAANLKRALFLKIPLPMVEQV